jgi:hypothetical protein
MAKENIITTISDLIGLAIKQLFPCKDKGENFLGYLWAVIFQIIFFVPLGCGILLLLSPFLIPYVIYSLFSDLVNGRL